eukprot:Sspe_Gene.88301::Locus_60341_Transcript_1_1_Confidence_1.000_Length_1263::g.88301::m.88301
MANLWEAGVKSGQQLANALAGSGIPDEEEMVRSAKESIERLGKLVRKLGDKAESVLEYEPLGHCVSSINQGFLEACEWLQSEEGSQAKKDDSAETAFQVHVKCRVLINRRFDLLEVVVESYVKRKETTAEQVITHILGKQIPDQTDTHWKWWQSRFGADKLLVPYDDFFEMYSADFSKALGPGGGEKWKEAMRHCVDYSYDGIISVYEFAFLSLWWFPTSYTPRCIGLFLKQGYFQPWGDRKNFSKLLKAPGDFFIRNTVNQGGNWCVSYIDPYLKPKHVLLALKNDTDVKGWVFPVSSAPERSCGKSLVSMVQKNSDCLQIPRGQRYDSLPDIDWDGVTHAAGADD